MKVKRSSLTSMIRTFLFETEEKEVEATEEKETTADFSISRYVVDSNKVEHQVSFKKEADLHTLYINNNQYNPLGVNAADKINNAFLSMAGLVLIQHENDLEVAKKMIEIIRRVDEDQKNKSDLAVLQSVRNKQNMLPYSLADELLNRDKI